MNEYKINHVNKKNPRFLSVLLEFCLGTNWQYKFSKLEQYTVHLWCLLFIEKKRKRSRISEQPQPKTAIRWGTDIIVLRYKLEQHLTETCSI